MWIEVVQGKLDHEHGTFTIEKFIGRDVRVEEVGDILSTMEAWFVSVLILITVSEDGFIYHFLFYEHRQQKCSELIQYADVVAKEGETSQPPPAATSAPAPAPVPAAAAAAAAAADTAMQWYCHWIIAFFFSYIYIHVNIVTITIHRLALLDSLHEITTNPALIAISSKETKLITDTQEEMNTWCACWDGMPNAARSAVDITSIIQQSDHSSFPSVQQRNCYLLMIVWCYN